MLPPKLIKRIAAHNTQAARDQEYELTDLGDNEKNISGFLSNDRTRVSFAATRLAHNAETRPEGSRIILRLECYVQAIFMNALFRVMLDGGFIESSSM